MAAMATSRSSTQGVRPDAIFQGGDGRAAIGPVLREYIVSEAMAALGIPTTRALAAITTGEHVYRETALPGAVLTRVASSTFGSARSSISPPGATSWRYANSPTTSSPATTRKLPRLTIPSSRCLKA